MKRKWILLTVLALGLLLALVFGLTIAQGQAPEGSAALLAEIGTAFTYQGRLTDAGGPVTGACDFTFDLYDEAGSGDPPTGGTLLGTDPKPGVKVGEGLFTVQLDFGAGAFHGYARWLQTTVDCGSGAITLSPRQELTPAPYALALPGLWTQQNAISPNLIGGSAANSVTSGVVGATIGGGGASAHPNRVTDSNGTVGGGLDNRAGNDDPDTFGQGATVGGGLSNTASGTVATVGGGGANSASGVWATVAGGGQNTASGNGATVAGGEWNTAAGERSFAAGYGAQALHDGTFVWADDTTGPYFASTAANQFLIRASGGVGIGTASPAFQLSLGSSTANTKLALYETGADNSYGLGVLPGSFRLHLNGSGARFAFLNGDQPGASEIVTMLGNGKVGIGTTNPAAKLHVAGTARTNVLEITGGADLAEPFEIARTEDVEPGMVVAIDPKHPEQLRISDKAYDRTVAGCVSGANGLNAGLTMQQEGTLADGAFPVALLGRVYCWADASYGPIQPGDLLTTSDTPGHVMKVTDYSKAQGAIIGKAMSALTEGQDLILVLVSLQ